MPPSTVTVAATPPSVSAVAAKPPISSTPLDSQRAYDFIRALALTLDDPRYRITVIGQRWLRVEAQNLDVKLYVDDDKIIVHRRDCNANFWQLKSIDLADPDSIQITINYLLERLRNRRH